MKTPLLKNGSLLVTDNFLNNEVGVTENLFEKDYVGDGEYLDLNGAMADFISLEKTTNREEIRRLDSDFSIALHKNLRVSRHIAAQSEFWHFLALTYGIEYIRKRWGNSEGKIKERDRVLGKWERNGLGRLWWWAELTSIGKDYKATKLGSNNQTFMLNIIDILIGGNKKVVIELINQVFDQDGNNILSESQIKYLFPKLNSMLVTVDLDYMQQSEITSIVTDLVSSALVSSSKSGVAQPAVSDLT